MANTAPAAIGKVHGFDWSADGEGLWWEEDGCGAPVLTAGAVDDSVVIYHPYCMGLPEEPFRAVFDPSFLRSNNFQDFAINLMACYFIVYHHGGKIDVQSEEAHGVTFTLTFPVRPKIVSSAEEQETFITKVLINERFWEKLISGQIG